MNTTGTKELSPPPPTAVDWIGTAIRAGHMHKPVIVHSQSWFQARSMVMALLGLGPEEVSVRQATEKESTP